MDKIVQNKSILEIIIGQKRLSMIRWVSRSCAKITMFQADYQDVD